MRKRVKKRAKQTGRDIPEDVLRESLKAPMNTVSQLTAKCDFVARINNDGSVPVLESFEVVDRSGR